MSQAPLSFGRTLSFFGVAEDAQFVAGDLGSLQASEARKALQIERDEDALEIAQIMGECVVAVYQLPQCLLLLLKSSHLPYLPQLNKVRRWRLVRPSLQHSAEIVLLWSAPTVYQERTERDYELQHPVKPRLTKQIVPCKGKPRTTAKGWTGSTRSTNGKNLCVLLNYSLILGGMTLGKCFPEDAAKLLSFRDKVSACFRGLGRPFYAIFEGPAPHLHIALLKRETPRLLNLAAAGQFCPLEDEELSDLEMAHLAMRLGKLYENVIGTPPPENFVDWKRGDPELLANYMKKRVTTGTIFEQKGSFPWLIFTPYFSVLVPSASMKLLRLAAPRASGYAQALSQFLAKTR